MIHVHILEDLLIRQPTIKVGKETRTSFVRITKILYLFEKLNTNILPNVAQSRFFFSEIKQFRFSFKRCSFNIVSSSKSHSFSCHYFEHRCTWVKNPGGVSSNFSKNIWVGGSGFQDKIARGRGVPYFEYYHIFINKFFQNLPQGVLFHPPSSTSTSLCIQMWFFQKSFFQKSFFLF